MATVIAEICLAPGEVGYYDDYSRIYLNTSRPTAQIYAGTNTTQIRRSIRSGRLRLISGSLNPPQAPVKEEPKKVVPKPVEKPVIKEEEKVEVKPVEIVEPIEEVPVEILVEEPVEEVVAEPVEEVAEEQTVKPKRRSRKKQAAE